MSIDFQHFRYIISTKIKLDYLCRIMYHFSMEVVRNEYGFL